MENRTVVLINPFEVEADNEAEFLRLWEQAADYMRVQPGFVQTRLHRTVLPDARFRFVNVAEWESADDWQAAMKGISMDDLHQALPPSYPSLYEVVRAL